MPGFFGGVRIFFRGVGMLVSTPTLYPLAMVPIVVAILLMVGFTWASVSFVPGFIAGLVGSSAWWATALQAVGTLASVIIGLFLALAFAQPVSGPALEALVRAAEKRIGAPTRPPTSVIEDMARGLGSALLSFGVATPLFLLLFILNLVPGGSFVAVPLKFVLAMVLIGWDLCDYPLSVRGMSLGDRLRFMSQHLAPVLGFSAGLAAIALLPCGALLILPAGVTGATLLLREIELARDVKPR